MPKVFSTFIALVITMSLFAQSPPPASNSAENHALQTKIRETLKLPINKALKILAKPLSDSSFYVPIVNPKVENNHFQFITGTDNTGKEWVYIYTSQTTLVQTFPKGSPYLQLKFVDLLKIVESDSRFGGINIDSSSDTAFPIPRATFELLKIQ